MATVPSVLKADRAADAPSFSTTSYNARWISPSMIATICAIVGILMIGARFYQQVYAWSAGLDATSPEFHTYWMNLLFGQFGAEALAASGIWGYLWFSRPKDLDRVETREELRRFGVFIALIFCYVFAVFWAASFFAEEDASWHQTVVRDTSFTPSHIILFYWAFPIYIILGISAYLYARTRLPRFAARHSLPWLIGVAGPFMLLPVVGYNEWAHSFWILEERFSAPVHWWFMIFAWAGLGLGGLLLQVCDYLYELTTGEAQTYAQGAGPSSDPALDFEREAS
jgi:methane/ammonia monooxygenase subunit C